MVEMEKEAGHTTAVMVATCPLCGQVLLSSSEMSQHVSSLPCGHVFHAACVRLHVASRYDCPVCRCPASVASLASLQLSCVAAPDPSGGRDVEGEVLDVLQTRAEDAAKENTELRAEVARLKREVDSEAVMFNMKVAELRNQFHRVEEQIRMKNAEIERLRAGDCDRSIVTETEILEDTLRSGVNVETSGIYTSLDLVKPPAPAPLPHQVLSCLRQFIIIVASVAIIIVITIVIPLKIAFTD